MRIIKNRNLRVTVLAGKCRRCGTMVECDDDEATWLCDSPMDPTATWAVECPDGCGWIYLSSVKAAHNTKLTEAEK
jgi:hypothetical protein